MDRERGVPGAATTRVAVFTVSIAVVSMAGFVHAMGWAGRPAPSTEVLGWTHVIALMASVVTTTAALVATRRGCRGVGSPRRRAMVAALLVVAMVVCWIVLMYEGMHARGPLSD